MEKMKFIDLFAGLGGFHQALSARGARCVFASELDESLAELYESNFGMRPHGDIREANLKSIPDHDILCAGFPCQPFSKAGDQLGLECPQWGDLFGYIEMILRLKKPRYFIIENVPNLVRHNNGKTWAVICSKLKKLHYDITFTKLSPHMFGIPQKRERAFIIGDLEGLGNFRWPTRDRPPGVSITSVLDENPAEARSLSPQHIRYLKAWQQFIKAFPKKEFLPTFPIWAMEFGATYPLHGPTPHKRKYKGLGRYRGVFGQPLKGLTAAEVEVALPGYALTKLREFPDWKIDFIQKNRDFYKKHQQIIDPWLHKIRAFPPSFQKLEWNCKNGERDIWKHIIQFRASGIRVKEPDTAPSLIAMTTSQVPVIAWEKRFMTPRECSRLQSMGDLEYLPETKGGAYKAFGNAVSVDVVQHIYDALVDRRVEASSPQMGVAAE